MNNIINNYLKNRLGELNANDLSWSLYLRFYFSLYFLTALQWNMTAFFKRDQWDNQSLNIILFWVPSQEFLFYLATLTSTLIILSWMYVLKNPLNARARFIFSFFAFVGLVIFNSHANVSHSSVGWILTSVYMVMLRFDESSLRKNFFLFKSAQAILLWLYFLSGLWKIRSLFSGASFLEVLTSLQNSVALQAIQADLYHPLIMKFVELSAPVLSLLWIALILLQVGSIFLILSDQWLPKLAFMLILFHLATDLLMNISFAPMMALVVVLLLMNPFFPREQQQELS